LKHICRHLIATLFGHPFAGGPCWLLLVSDRLILARSRRLTIETLWTTCGSPHSGHSAGAGAAFPPRLPNPRDCRTPCFQNFARCGVFASGRPYRCALAGPANFSHWTSRNLATVFSRGGAGGLRLPAAPAVTSAGDPDCASLARSSLYVLHPAMRQACEAGPAEQDRTWQDREAQAARRRSGKEQQDEPSGSSQRARRGQPSTGAIRPARQTAFTERHGREGLYYGRINSPIGSHQAGAGVPPPGADRLHRCFAGTAHAERQIGTTRSPRGTKRPIAARYDAGVDDRSLFF
jgi:hypothetical protein